MKRYDDYYDQHQLKAIEILEELALSFMGNNQISEAERIVEKISRMNANSHVIRILRTNQREKRSPLEAIPKSKASKKKFCHLNHFLSSNIFTCPIWCKWSELRLRPNEARKGLKLRNFAFSRDDKGRRIVAWLMWCLNLIKLSQSYETKYMEDFLRSSTNVLHDLWTAPQSETRER